MKEDSKAKVKAAGIGAVAAVIAALITTLGTIFASQSKIADVVDKANAATKLFAQISAPPGAILAYAGPLDEDELRKAGWLPCDGREVKREDYPRLFQALGAV